MAELKPAYLISGQDDAKIDAWRARVRARAAAEGGTVEPHDARMTTPEDVAVALSTPVLGSTTRFVLTVGVEAWKPAALEPLERSLGDMPPDTVLVLIAGGKPPARLADAVADAGGEVRSYPGPKPWEMPRWAADRAAEAGLKLDAEAAKALVAAVGDRRPQRLLREVEKLVVLAHPRAELSAADVERLATPESTAGAYDLADALVAGDHAAALSLAQELRRTEEHPGRLTYPVARRLREVHRAAGLLEAGASEKQVASAMRLAPWIAKRTVASARRADRDTLERALCAFADFELETRAGGGVDEDTAFSVALARAAG